MKNLENCGLVELNSYEVIETNGGSILTGNHITVVLHLWGEVQNFAKEFGETMKNCHC